jgi:hypothetical protein
MEGGKSTVLENLVHAGSEVVTAGLNDASPAVVRAALDGFSRGNIGARTLIVIDNRGRFGLRFCMQTVENESGTRPRNWRSKWSEGIAGPISADSASGAEGSRTQKSAILKKIAQSGAGQFHHHRSRAD